MKIPTSDLPTEDTAWCAIAGTNGYVIRTNSYGDYPAGAAFVTVVDPAGNPVTHQLAADWSDPSRAQDAMATIWRAAAAELVLDDEYGWELAWSLANGEVRACLHGSYVRLLHADGAEVDGGSAYWVSDEWVEDGELVMGAVLGGAAALQ